MKNLKSRFIALVALLLPLAGFSGRAGAGTVLMTRAGPGGHTYAVIADTAMTWSGAEADARARGGFLATIGDANEQSFVQGLLTDADAQSGSYWFGLRET